MRICKRCNLGRGLEMFSKNSQSKDGLQTWCKGCCNEVNTIKRNLKNSLLPTLPPFHKRCTLCNVVKHLDCFNLNKKGKYQKTSRCKECMSITFKKWREGNLDHLLIKGKKWRGENPKYHPNFHKLKKQSDPIYKLKEGIRVNMYGAFKRALKGICRKKTSTQFILGCTLEEFINHIQSQFTEGMTLENYGEWHLDHIIPLATAKFEEDVIRLNHYTNFQPLWAADNLKKGFKMLG